MVNTSLQILLYTFKSVANYAYLCTYSKWGVMGGGIMQFILLTGSCWCITNSITLCLSMCVCVLFPFFTPLIHSQDLLFLLVSYLDIPPLPYSKTLSPHYVSIADNTLKLIAVYFSLFKPGTKDKGITVMFLGFCLLLLD